MSPASYQTIRLSKGKHTDPEDGACVMELASMLAGEPFTDHPASVCPVIGSFLRSYNDSSTPAGARRCTSTPRRSSAAAVARGPSRREPHGWRNGPRRCSGAAGRGSSSGRCAAIGRLRRPPIDAIGTYAVHSICKHTDRTHASVLALVDELLEISARDERVSARVLAAIRARSTRQSDLVPEPTRPAGRRCSNEDGTA